MVRCFTFLLSTIVHDLLNTAVFSCSRVFNHFPYVLSSSVCLRAQATRSAWYSHFHRRNHEDGTEDEFRGKKGASFSVEPLTLVVADIGVTGPSADSVK